MSAVPVVAGRRRPGLARLHPEPARLWIVYAPRTWPAGEAPWIDLAAGRLRALRQPARHRGGAALPQIDAADLDDLCYLPPVAAGLAAARDRWAAVLIESGSPVLVQLEPGTGTGASGAQVVYDLLRPLLAGDLSPLARLPAGSSAVWPLLPGLTDSPELWDRGCELLARAGSASVLPLAVELAADDRRRLAELGGEDAFDALFHSQAPSERDFARHAARHDLAVFAPRPAAGGTARQVRNRRLAADLTLAGDLWLRLGKSVGGGQALFRAARGAESTSRDLAAVAREGNLGVLDWLDERSVALVGELVAGGRSSLLESLLEEYLTSP